MNTATDNGKSASALITSAASVASGLLVASDFVLALQRPRVHRVKAGTTDPGLLRNRIQIFGESLYFWGFNLVHVPSAD